MTTTASIEERIKLEAALTRCDLRGVHPAVELEAAGLLLTGTVRKKLRAHTLRDLVETLRPMPVQTFLSSSGLSLIDFKAGLLSWITEQADILEGMPVAVKPAAKKARKKGSDDGD